MVDEWAHDVCYNLGDDDEEPWTSRDGERESGHRALWVRDLHDEEEAFERGIPIWKGIDIVPPGPKRAEGGVRRVSIRFYTWTLDEKYGTAYEPAWVTTGWGMSAHAATMAHYRWTDDYALAVKQHRESRKLIATAIEIAFWTAGASADYV